MKCLVTGGAGFVGSHLVEHLLERGDSVVVLDDLSTGSVENIEHLENRPEFDYVIDTVAHEALLQNLINDVDLVFHLADVVGVRLVMERPVEALEAVLSNSELVLNAAAQAEKKVLICSSAEVYGRGADAPCREDDELVFGPISVPRFSYGLARAAVEHLALGYARQEKLAVVIARVFNTAGPRQPGRYGQVLPRFVEQALAGEPITVYGDGTQRRSFCDVGDVVTCLVGLADCPAALGKVVNVGSAEEVSILKLAETVRKELAPKVEVQQVSYETAYGPGFEDLARRVPDLTRLKGLIGFEPKTSLTEIVNRVAVYVRDRRKHTVDTVVGRPRRKRAAKPKTVPNTDGAEE